MSEPMDGAKNESGEETALLVGLQQGRDTREETESSLDELERLVRSTGAKVLGKRAIHLRTPRASTLISLGHLEDLAQWIDETDCSFVVIDEDLSPAQQRNLEKELKCRVVTRPEIILDIFAIHARSREAKTQVELAQLRYRMPRLVGATIATARMGGMGVGAGGGVAMRGPGETQLEVDRRLIRARIRRLEASLKQIERQRNVQRRRRNRSGMMMVGLVGYTNAGKSTLLNRLTAAGVLVEDRLFSTLDTTVRTLSLPGGLEVGLIDTVGFVSKLPPTLVAAFRSTLEEVTFADVVIHVVDATSPRQAVEFATTEEVLVDLHCEHTPRLVVWNKIDRIGDAVERNALALRRKPSVAISALEGIGIEALLRQIEQMVMAVGLTSIVRIPYEQFSLVARIHREGQVLEDRDLADAKLLRCRLAGPLLAAVEPYLLEEWPEELDEAAPAGSDSPST